MLKKKQKKWRKLYEKLKEPTRICKLCFNPIETNSICYFLGKDINLCNKCRSKLQPIFQKIKIDDIKGYSVYGYDENIKSLLYQLKGCYDIAIADIFLANFIKMISLLFSGFWVIFVPSLKSEDEQRGFNHVKEIFLNLKLPEIHLFEKKDYFKQAKNSSKQRKNIINHIQISDIKEANKIKNKKILIVDDVITTGSTLKACINLIKPYAPKKIKLLVMSKSIKNILA